MKSKLTFRRFDYSEIKNTFSHFEFVSITIIAASKSNFDFYSLCFLTNFLLFNFFYFLSSSLLLFTTFSISLTFFLSFLFLSNLRILRTLINTLRTWKSSGLLDLVTQRLMILNDPYPSEVKYHTILFISCYFMGFIMIMCYSIYVCIKAALHIIHFIIWLMHLYNILNSISFFQSSFNFLRFILCFLSVRTNNAFTIFWLFP